MTEPGFRLGAAAHSRQGQACPSQTRVLGASASQRLAWPPVPSGWCVLPMPCRRFHEIGERVCLEEAPCPRDSSELWSNSTCQAGLQFYQVCIVSAGPRRPPQIPGTTLPSFPTSTPHRPSLSLVLPTRTTTTTTPAAPAPLPSKRMEVLSHVGSKPLVESSPRPEGWMSCSRSLVQVQLLPS